MVLIATAKRNGVRRDESRDPVEGQPDDERVELDCSAGGDRRIDDGTYRCWVARDVRPEQALVLMQLARGQVNDRLEVDVVSPDREEQVEHLRLDRLDRLAHPDPVRNARQLDCGGQRVKILLRLGQARVHLHKAVIGAAARAGDFGSNGLGKRLDRGDETGARPQFKDAAVRDPFVEAVQKSDIPRPDQPLVTTPLITEEAHGPPRR